MFIFYTLYLFINNVSLSIQEYSKEAVAYVQKYLMKNEVPVNLFEPYIEEIFNHLRSEPFRKFLERYVVLKSKENDTEAMIFF